MRNIIYMVIGGSSPRVQGTLDADEEISEVARFIPVSAGNTYENDLRVAQLSVHPRECEEHGNVPRSISPVSGSSPRVRGTLLRR